MARAALNGDAAGTPKAGGGTVESVRVLRLARRSAIKARTQAANQIRDLTVTAPDQLRSRLRDLDTNDRVAVCARFRTGDVADHAEATRISKLERGLIHDAELARRYEHWLHLEQAA